MLTFLEYRVLKFFSKYANEFLMPQDTTLAQDRARFLERQLEFSEKTKTKWFHVKTVAEKLLDEGYLDLDSVLSSSGLTELHQYWKKWWDRLIDNLLRLYLPLIISVIALTLSLITFSRQ